MLFVLSLALCCFRRDGVDAALCSLPCARATMCVLLLVRKLV